MPSCGSWTRRARDLETGEVGELWIHNANLMAGYLGEDEAARAGFAEGWYRTGDLARLGPAGHVELVGRRREIVKNVHGEIVTLREIEDALLACGDVADAGVFVTRRAEQEIVHAVVVPASGLAGRANWLEQRAPPPPRAARSAADAVPARDARRDPAPRGREGPPLRARAVAGRCWGLIVAGSAPPACPRHSRPRARVSTARGRCCVGRRPGPNCEPSPTGGPRGHGPHARPVLALGR